MPSRTATPARASSHNRIQRLLPAFLVIAVGVAAYANSFQGAFVFDDRPNLLENPYIRRLWPLSQSLSAPDQSSLAGRPVLALSFAATYAIFGLDVRGYHALNLAVHLVAGLLLFGIARRTLTSSPLRDRFGPSATPLAAVIAALWVAHPLQTASVTYITQRAESLAGLFYLLALYAVIRSDASPRRWLWQIGAVLACGLGMGTKETVATAPLLILLYDSFFLTRSIRAALQQRGPLYAGLASMWLLLAALVAGGPRSMSVGFNMAGPTPLQYGLTQPGVILHYLRLAFWPHWLCLDYDWPIVASIREAWPSAIAIGLLLLATVGLWYRRNSIAFTGLCFFLILAPTSSLIPIKDLAFEHRMYLPLAAVIALAVVGGYSILRKWKSVRVAVAVALLAAATGRTVLRNRDYHSELAIWQDTVSQRPNNAKALCCLGAALLDLGRDRDAIAELERAVQLDRDDATTHYNLGIVYARIGRHADAVASYHEAIRLRSSEFRSHYNLANLLRTLGRLDEAVREYREAIRCSPNDFRGHFNLAISLQSQGKLQEAADEYRAVLKFKPDHEKTKLNLEYLDKRIGR